MNKKGERLSDLTFQSVQRVTGTCQLLRGMIEYKHRSY